LDARFDFAKPTVAQLFVRFLLRFLSFRTNGAVDEQEASKTDFPDRGT
jgi:hypothetical protein